MLNLVLILLSIGLILTIAGIVREVIKQHKCIPEAIMKKFMHNTLPKEEKAMVTTHLGICENCQQRLHDFNFSEPKT